MGVLSASLFHSLLRFCGLNPSRVSTARPLRPLGRFSKGESPPLIGEWRLAAFVEPLEDRRLLAVDVALVRDLNLNTLDASPSNLVAVGAITYFTANDPAFGIELWKTDGTSSGTSLVKCLGSA